MKFKAEPGLYVKISNKYIQRVSKLKGLHFDGNGEYKTDNETLIKLLSQHFEAVSEVPEIVEEVAPDVLPEVVPAATEKIKKGGVK